MISIRCTTAILFSLLAEMGMIYNIVCLTNTADESRMKRESTTIYPELPQNDMTDPRLIVGPNDPCHMFSNADFEKKEFYSPGYPEFYPNHTDCVLVLEAPEGHLINLDFREYFDIEPSPGCANDYLEVRDGPHGYNKLIRNLFCGRGQFPPMLTSSDRHLWIHFRSDENIEYQGFKAVFDFVPRPANISTPEKLPCRIEVSGEDQGTLSKDDLSNETLAYLVSKDMPIDCIWVITVKDGWRIQLNFDVFQLEKPYDCENNFIDLFSDRTDMPSRDKNFCGSVPEAYASKHNIMFIRFYADTKAMKSTFKATFTAYRETEKTFGCFEGEFDCEDATCIAETLRCNGIANCRFRSDEDKCDINKKIPLGESHIVIIMVIFSLILSGMCFTFIFNCVKKLIRDHQTIQEYIRESRDQQLNQLGKHDHQHHMEKTTKIGRSRSNSNQSLDESRKFQTSNAMPIAPCYVPGSDLLPILMRNDNNTNNGDPFNNTNLYDTTEIALQQHHRQQHEQQQQQQQQPEMCDSACQTRESLFATHLYGSGSTGGGGVCMIGSEHSTPNHSITSTNSKPSPPAPFSTFGYKKDNNQISNSSGSSGGGGCVGSVMTNKYRAEAKIEMERIDKKHHHHHHHNQQQQAPPPRYEDKRRPYSVQTTKSAPDVIVTH